MYIIDNINYLVEDGDFTATAYNRVMSEFVRRFSEKLQTLDTGGLDLTFYFHGEVLESEDFAVPDITFSHVEDREIHKRIQDAIIRFCREIGEKEY